MKKILVTGSSGFIGFHMSQLLLSEHYKVIGYDSMNNYYDIKLKKERLLLLKKHKNFIFFKNKLENKKYLKNIFKKHKPDIVIHLAAQAGVRHSINSPEPYLQANIIGTFNLLECCKELNVKHILIASTSSAYGANMNLPYKENDSTSTPMSIYSATKLATESICHAYSYNWSIPITMFRFFTVYGPWGRPDMALFKFTKNIYANKSIEIFNDGKMHRDFTYVKDIVQSIKLLMNKVPSNLNRSKKYKNDSLSPVAPFRIINIGNSEKIPLMKFVKIIEKTIGKKAKYKFLKMQKGDVVATHADTSLLHEIIKFKPSTSINDGIKNFINWYEEYYM